MKTFRKYAINILLILVFTFTALFFVLKDRWVAVLDILDNIQWYDFILIFGWAFLVVVCSGWILKVITKSFGYKYSIFQGMASNMVSNFFAGITPSASGGQIGQLYLYKKQGIDFSDGASILWYEFLVYQMVMVGYVLVLLLLKFTYYYTNFSAFYLLIMLGFFMQSIVIIFLFTMILFPQFYVKAMHTLIQVLSKLKFVKSPEKIKNTIEKEVYIFKDNVHLFKQKKMLLVKVVLLNVLKLTFFYSVPVVVCIALQIPLTVSQYIDIIALTAFVTMANAFFPIPGASGGTESVFVLVFSNIFGITIASAVMIIWRFATYYFMLFIGGITFLVFKILHYQKDEKIIEESTQVNIKKEEE